MSSSIQTAKAVRGDFRWDVFLSYRSPDRNEVEEVAKKLVEMGLRVWWDEQEIPPGASPDSEAAAARTPAFPPFIPTESTAVTAGGLHSV